MKYSTLTAFEKHLVGAAPNHFAEVYLILAKESFARKQAIDRLSKLVIKEESSGEFCLQIFDAERQPIDLILQELETLSFFIKKRLIVVHNVEAFDKASTTKLESYLANPNRSVCLVLTASSVNRNTTFYKKTEKAGVILDVAEEKPWEREKSMVEWLRAEAALAGKQMTPQTCQLMVKQLGTDQALLHGEMQKLICYVGEKSSIEERDISAICVSINLENIWQLGEALFRRDAATALRISKNFLSEGTALIAFLRQIRSQFQTEYQVCSILSRGGTAAEVAQEFPYMKGAILDRHIQQSQAYGMQRFKEGLLAIDETELKAKNSSADPDLLAERLIIKLVS